MPLAGWSVSLQSHSPFSALLQSTFCFKISSYLDLIRNSANRKDLVKIRLSNHKLMIKTGRYNQTSRNDRFCPICNSGIIEGEFHFLFHCRKYSIPREKFYNQIQENFFRLNSATLHRIIIKVKIYNNDNAMQLLLQSIKCHQHDLITN